MKAIMSGLLLVVSVFALTACSNSDDTIDDVTSNATTYYNDIDVNTEIDGETDTDDDFGSAGALSNDTFTLEDILLYAIQDEYATRQENTYIPNNFDTTKPFSNILKAEETHITLLTPLFETYNIELPEDTSLQYLVPVSSVEEAFDIGVIAEINNIAMYNLFLEQDDLPDDVRDVLISLRDASENHLAAFQKNAEKY